MSIIIKAIPIYNFLNYCNDSDLDKNVLDCGAGGAIPPLYIFYKNGYKTYGIDSSKTQIDKAEKFCKKNNIMLNIKEGDMKSLEFPDQYFSFIYSYNSIFHMKKSEIVCVLNEIKRVLKKDGLCFVNFLSRYDSRFREGIEITDGEYLQEEDDSDIIHSYFYDNEAEKYLKDFKIIFKEKKVTEKYIDNKKYRLAYIEYIVKKR